MYYITKYTKNSFAHPAPCMQVCSALLKSWRSAVREHPFSLLLPPLLLLAACIAGGLSAVLVVANNSSINEKVRAPGCLFEAARGIGPGCLFESAGGVAPGCLFEAARGVGPGRLLEPPPAPVEGLWLICRHVSHNLWISAVTSPIFVFLFFRVCYCLPDGGVYMSIY